MALTEAQRRAQAKYVRETVKQTTVRFYPKESDLWEWLGSQENKAGYIKDLIRADMEARHDA
nr:MAG TPA: INTRON-ENCODED ENDONUCLEASE I-PPOI/DNA COMPLEX (HOMING ENDONUCLEASE-DNA), INTRON, DNA.8A [Caudoviricetes sp.]